MSTCKWRKAATEKLDVILLTGGTMDDKILYISVAMIFGLFSTHDYRYYYHTLLSKLLLKHNQLSIRHKLYF